MKHGGVRFAVAESMPVRDRLMYYVAVHVKTRCWEWLGSRRNGSGYGQITLDGHPRLAHRVAYQAFVGPIPSGLQLDHLCRNRGCVNPAHLEPVTASENNHRGRTNAAKTHCPQGHPYTPENTYITPANRRTCRSCRHAHIARFRERRD